MHSALQLLVVIQRFGMSHGGRKPLSRGEMALIALTLIIVVGGMYYFTWRKERYWGNNTFPPKLKPTPENLVIAHLVAAGMMLEKDRSKTAGKLVFINNYLLRRFPLSYENSEVSYNEAMQRRVTIKSLAYWLNLHLSATQRQQIVDFLIDLSVNDGEINDHEQLLIRRLTAALELDPSATEEQLKKHRPEKKTVKPPLSLSRKQRYEVVLGLNAGYTPEEIKKVYRTLVKLYHPDKFMQHTAEARENAAAKFREIQEAYDFLINEI